MTGERFTYLRDVLIQITDHPADRLEHSIRSNGFVADNGTG